MFNTFRKRLLFWFLVFISSNLLIITLVWVYLDRRQKIENTAQIIQNAHLHFLKYIKSQQDFLGFDTKQNYFFETNISQNLDNCKSYFDSTIIFIDSAIIVSEDRFAFDDDLEKFSDKAYKVDSLYNQMVGLVFIRGFKDFNVIGEIRQDAHWLEEAPELSVNQILQLRRHEKDYIIRNDKIYVQNFNYLIEEAVRLLRIVDASKERKDTIATVLRSYQTHFNELVDLDDIIGINTNTGLKKSIDNTIQEMESEINHIVFQTFQRKQTQFKQLNMIFILLVVFLLVISLITSYFISKNMTTPLKTLTNYIGDFVVSDFMLDEPYPAVKSKDEVGLLSRNFLILRDEVVSSIKFFKQKVEERTQELARANEKLILINNANRRFVPDNFLKLLGKSSIEEIGLGDQMESDMTVMFTDIRSFTQISENLSPQQNLDFINAYLKEIVPVIQSHGGFIDKYIGDSIMALFPDNPESAFLSALEFKGAIENFNHSLNAKGMDSIRIGTGIHTGHLILGTVGTDNRLDTTVISDAVNLSSRIEGLTKYYGVDCIFTDESILSVKNKSQFNFRFLDYVKVKGRSNPISIYELLQIDDRQKLDTKELYEDAVNHYFNHEFEKAIEIFKVINAQNTHDMPSRVYLKRCTELIERGTDENWDFIMNMTDK